MVSNSKSSMRVCCFKNTSIPTEEDNDSKTGTPLCSLLTRLGFRENDPCVHVCMSKKKRVEIVAVYVDDLILITETQEEMQQIKQSLTNIYTIKNLREIHYCLGVNVHVDENNISLCQVSTLNNYLTSMDYQKLTQCLSL